MNRFWVCLLLFANWTISIQAQEVEWLTQAGGLKYDSGMDISLDSEKNSLVVGVFSDTLQLEGTELASLGGTDLFIAKYDAAGTLQWANQAGSKANDEAFGVSTDPLGNVYVTGYFRDTVDFAGNKLYASGFFNDDVFIAKYQADGTFLWARQLGGAGSDIAYDIAVDTGGNAYITGRFAERFTAPIEDNGTPFTFISKGVFDIFVAKYNTDGQRMWVRQYGGENYDSASAIAVDNSGNYHLTGFFNGILELGESSLISNGDFDIFAAKFDESGTLQWMNQAGGAYSDLGTAIDLDDSGNAYLTGSYEDTAFFGTENITTHGSTDFFLTKINESGEIQWVRQAGGEDADIGLGIATDANGNSHLTGSFSQMLVLGGDTIRVDSTNTGAIFLLQYNTDGMLQQKTVSSGRGYDEGTAIAIDEDSNCYLTGSFSRTLKIGENSLESNGNSDLFVAKIRGDFTDINNSFMINQSFLTVYPNPVGERLFVEFESEKQAVYSLQLMDYAGRIVHKELFENTQGVHVQ
ncbi:MAG: SBBP repeat-containing protein, partial [Chitinophagales bacterium]